jgi:hypothetical protein
MRIWIIVGLLVCDFCSGVEKNGQESFNLIILSRRLITDPETIDRMLESREWEECGLVFSDKELPQNYEPVNHRSVIF